MLCVFRGGIAKTIWADEGFNWAALSETCVWKTWGTEHMFRWYFTQLHTESKWASVYSSTQLKSNSVFCCITSAMHFSQADVCALLKCARKLLSAGLFSPHLLWQEYWTHQVCACICVCVYLMINSDMSHVLCYVTWDRSCFYMYTAHTGGDLSFTHTQNPDVGVSTWKVPNTSTHDIQQQWHKHYYWLIDAVMIRDAAMSSWVSNQLQSLCVSMMTTTSDDRRIHYHILSSKNQFLSLLIFKHMHIIITLTFSSDETGRSFK